MTAMPEELDQDEFDTLSAPGFDVSDRIERGLLLCFSELHTRGEIDRLVQALGELR